MEVVLGRDLARGDARGSWRSAARSSGRRSRCRCTTRRPAGSLPPGGCSVHAPPRSWPHGRVVVEAEVHRGARARAPARAARARRSRPSSAPAASQPLSTADRKGTSGEPSAGHVVRRAPVAGSYQLKNWPPGPRSRRASVAERARHPRGRLAAADEPDLARAQRAPQVGADVGRRGVARALRRRPSRCRRAARCARRRAGRTSATCRRRSAAAPTVAVREPARRGRRRGDRGEQQAARTVARAGRNVGPAPTVPRIAGGRNLHRTAWRARFGPNGSCLRFDERCKDHGAMASEPATAPIEYHAREGFLDEVFAGPARLRAPPRRRSSSRRSSRWAPSTWPPPGAGATRSSCSRASPSSSTGEDGPQGPPLPARPRAADHPGRRVDRRSSAASRSASAR